MLSPEDIEAREFLVSLRGYDRDEVTAFLGEVAQQMRALQARVDDLERSSSAAPVGAPAHDAGTLIAEIGAQTQRILDAAQEAATEITRHARTEADRELQEARAHAAGLVADGERRRETIARELADLERAHHALSDKLRAAVRTVEQVLGDVATGSGRPALWDAPAADGPGHVLSAPSAGDVLGAPAPLQVLADGGPEPGEPLTLRADALGPLHPKLVRGLKRGLQDLQNVTLDRIRRAGADTDSEGLLPTAEELGALAGAADDLLAEAWQKGVAAAAVLAGNEQRTPPARSGMGERLGEDVGDRVSAQLGATLRMGLSGGEDSAALSDRVGVVFGELKGPQAEELAGDHLTRAYELGLLDAWSASGIARRRWVLGKEPRCPEGRCRSNDQAGGVDVGAVFPSGHDVPPVHVGCTCTTLPLS